MHIACRHCAAASSVGHQEDSVQRAVAGEPQEDLHLSLSQGLIRSTYDVGHSSLLWMLHCVVFFLQISCLWIPCASAAHQWSSQREDMHRYRCMCCVCNRRKAGGDRNCAQCLLDRAKVQGPVCSLHQVSHLQLYPGRESQSKHNKRSHRLALLSDHGCLPCCYFASCYTKKIVHTSLHSLCHLNEQHA